MSLSFFRIRGLAKHLVSLVKGHHHDDREEEDVEPLGGDVEPLFAWASPSHAYAHNPLVSEALEQLIMVAGQILSMYTDEKLLLMMKDLDPGSVQEPSSDTMHSEDGLLQRVWHQVHPRSIGSGLLLAALTCNISSSRVNIARANVVMVQSSRYESVHHLDAEHVEDTRRELRLLGTGMEGAVFTDEVLLYKYFFNIVGRTAGYETRAFLRSLAGGSRYATQLCYVVTFLAMLRSYLLSYAT
jgi:hypothetical protein